jgi:hypothetical protein
MRFIEHRIGDPRILRLIREWLKAGVMENGEWKATEEGTPCYIELMEYWNAVLPGKILRVQHEDVVQDLEGNVRRLLEFCGLEFEPQCVEFYKTERNVRTASFEQVRRLPRRHPLRSPGRWQRPAAQPRAQVLAAPAPAAAARRRRWRTRAR